MNTTSTTSNSNLKKEAAKYGLYLGLISMALTVIVFYSTPQLLASPSFGIISILITVGIAIYFALELRKNNGGYWSFGEALPALFITFFVSSLTSTLLLFAFNKVEPTYEETMRSVTLNAMTEMGEKFFPNNPEQVDLMIEEGEKALEKQFNPTIGQFFQGQLIGVIVAFVIALIFALIFKRNRPVFVVPDEDEDEYSTANKE
jgi:heme/copper-type cytochrome/quinol oxidase subunit 4